MEKIGIEELARQVDLHIANESYDQGLELATTMREHYPQRLALIDYWRICLAALSGENQQACSILEQALSSGTWYAAHVLRQSPPLAGLQTLPEYENLVHISAEMEKADPVRSLPLLVTHAEGQCKDSADPCPLLIYLHSNESTAHENLEYWHPSAQEGWLLAMPQSLQAYWSGAFGWHDVELAAEQLEQQIERLVSSYKVDPDQIILAGSGAGAELALWLALSGTINAIGLLLINPDGPYLRNKDSWTKVYDYDQAAQKGLRGLVLYDSSAAYTVEDNLAALSNELAQKNIPLALEIFSSTASTGYPDDFIESLPELIDKVLFG